MRTAGLPEFMKLWAIIEEDIAPGKYTIQVKSKTDVSNFNGKKYVVLSNTNIFGGKNWFLSFAYLAVGGGCIFFAFVYSIAYWRKTEVKTN